MPGGVHPPVEVVLTWPRPNHDNPETEGPGLIIVSIILVIVTTVIIALRLWARIFIIRQPGLDDLLIVFGYVCAILLTALVILANVTYGVGGHIWDLPLPKAAPARLVTWLSKFCVIIGGSCTKISILLFYRRLATGSYSRSFLWAVRVGILYNILYCIGFTIYIFVECRPMEAYWQQFALNWHRKFTCSSEHISLPVNGGLSVLSDFYAAILPALLIRKLQMPRKQKYLLYCLFALGFLVVAAGIMRTIAMDTVINQTYDTTHALYPMWIWILVENYLAICCASAPALKPLYVRYISPHVSSAIGRLARHLGGDLKHRRYIGAGSGAGNGGGNNATTGDLSYSYYYASGTGKPAGGSKFGLMSTAESYAMTAAPAKTGKVDVKVKAKEKEDRGSFGGGDEIRLAKSLDYNNNTNSPTSRASGGSRRVYRDDLGIDDDDDDDDNDDNYHYGHYNHDDDNDETPLEHGQIRVRNEISQNVEISSLYEVPPPFRGMLDPTRTSPPNIWDRIQPVPGPTLSPPQAVTALPRPRPPPPSTLSRSRGTAAGGHGDHYFLDRHRKGEPGRVSSRFGRRRQRNNSTITTATTATTNTTNTTTTTHSNDNDNDSASGAGAGAVTTMAINIREARRHPDWVVAANGNRNGNGL